MLERLPFFRFYAADYLIDTVGLPTTEHHGAYLLLIVNYFWDGEIPADREALYAMCRANGDSARAAVDLVLTRFFHLENGRYVHHRIEREITHIHALTARQSAAGKRSAEVRASKKPVKPVKSAPKQKNQPETFAVPDWMNAQLFRDWIQIRPSKARTPAAQRAAIAKLDALRSKGYDPLKIVAESLSNGWQGIFEPKEPPEVHSNVRRLAI